MSTASITLQGHTTTFAQIEITGLDLPTIDQSERQAICPGTKFLHQVQRQCSTSWAQGMQKTDLGIKPCGLQSAAAVVHPHGVQK